MKRILIPAHVKAGLLAVALATLPAVMVAAGSSPSQAAVNDQSVSGSASSIWQTDNPVEALAASGGVLYAGGSFTHVRPPGAAAGSQQTSRTYLAAFTASTGALVTGFNVTLNGAVEDLAVSPSGKLLYLAGRFTTVDGVARSRVAAINLPSGTLNSTFNASAGNTVTAIDVSSSAIYLGGDFAMVDGTSKSRLAAVDPTTGALITSFTADVDARPYVIKLAPDGSRVMVGGNFTTVNGSATSSTGSPNAGIVSLSPTTGAVQRWDASLVQPINTSCTGRVTDIVTQGSTAFVTAEGDPPGCYEGTYSANIATGALNWNESCLGASQGLALLGNVLYKGSHQHDCAFNPGGARGGFVGGTSRDAFIHRYLTAQNIQDGTFVHWTPNTNASGGGSPVGPHTMASDGTQVFVGGDFTRVNSSAQQGLTRFTATGNAATPKTPGLSIIADSFGGMPGKLAANLAITVLPTKANTLTVEVPAVEDSDSGTLTYELYRDGGTTAIASQTAASYPWSRPVVRFDDSGLTPGSSHSYRVAATDGTYTSTKSTAVSGTVSAAAPASFASVYQGLNPQLWWRLSDTGSTAADSSTGGHPGTLQGGATTGQPGAVSGNTAVTLNGSTGYVASSNTISAPKSFSESGWFKTTTVSGGNILSQTDTRTGAGGNTDRMITMDDNGGLVFAMKAAGDPSPFGPVTINFRNQGPIWNDGKWHFVVGTYDGTTASLYVDGALQGTATGTPFDSTATAQGMPTSYLRAGYADLSQIQVVFGINFYNQHWPASEHFAGSVDEVAAFPTVLSAAQVRTMYAAGVAGGA